jgi:hypothetical protein
MYFATAIPFPKTITFCPHMAFKTIKMDSLEQYGYSSLKLIIPCAGTVETQLKTISKQAPLTVVPKHLVGANNKTGPRHGGEWSFLMLKLPERLGPRW